MVVLGWWLDFDDLRGLFQLMILWVYDSMTQFSRRFRWAPAMVETRTGLCSWGREKEKGAQSFAVSTLVQMWAEEATMGAGNKSCIVALPDLEVW